MGRGVDAELADLHYYLEEASRIAKKLNQEYSRFYDVNNYSLKALLEVERIQREREKFKRLVKKSLEAPSLVDVTNDKELMDKVIKASIETQRETIKQAKASEEE